jgi:hypothetical protein
VKIGKSMDLNLLNIGKAKDLKLLNIRQLDRVAVLDVWCHKCLENSKLHNTSLAQGNQVVDQLT